MTKFEAIERLIKEARERAISAGAWSVEVDAILIHAESQMVQNVVEKGRAYALACRVTGTAVMAERAGITRRAVNKRKARLLANARGT